MVMILSFMSGTSRLSFVEADPIPGFRVDKIAVSCRLRIGMTGFCVATIQQFVRIFWQIAAGFRPASGFRTFRRCIRLGIAEFALDCLAKRDGRHRRHATDSKRQLPESQSGGISERDHGRTYSTPAVRFA